MIIWWNNELAELWC